MRSRFVALCIALFVVAGCGITLPFQASPTGSPPAVSTTSYPTAEQALRVLVEHHVDRPSSKALLEGAVDEVGSYLQSHNLIVPSDTPTFTGATEDDLRAFAAYADAVLARSPGAPKAEVERAAVTGMAKAARECHTYYLDPERARTFNQATNQRYSGIGARVQQLAPNTSTLPVITQVFPDSPAERAGVQMGDRIKSGNVLYEVDRDGQAVPKPVNPKAYYPYQKPLAVLVDQNTASGAEIIASAIQEHGVGRVFGQPTLGCISIGVPRELPDGGLLLYTYAKIQSPVKRQDLSGKGVTPDEIVSRAPDAPGDPVLDAAVAWLSTQTH